MLHLLLTHSAWSLFPDGEVTRLKAQNSAPNSQRNGNRERRCRLSLGETGKHADELLIRRHATESVCSTGRPPAEDSCAGLCMLEAVRPDSCTAAGRGRGGLGSLNWDLPAARGANSRKRSLFKDVFQHYLC